MRVKDEEWLQNPERPWLNRLLPARCYLVLSSLLHLLRGEDRKPRVEVHRGVVFTELALDGEQLAVDAPRSISPVRARTMLRHLLEQAFLQILR